MEYQSFQSVLERASAVAGKSHAPTKGDDIISFISAENAIFDENLFDDIIMSYFVDLTFGTDFGLRMIKGLIEGRHLSRDNILYVCLYLSYYSSADDIVEEIKRRADGGDAVAAQSLIENCIAKLAVS